MNNDDNVEQTAWYLRRQGRQIGPFNSGTVRRLLLQGQVNLEDEVSADRERWQLIAEVAAVVPPELRSGTHADTQAPPPAIPWRAIGLFACLVCSVIAIALWWGGEETISSPNCQSAPAPGVDWRNCRLTALQAPSAPLRAAQLQNADLAGAKLAGADLTAARLDYAGLRQADLAYALLQGASLRGADLRGADLTHANLVATDLSFADLTGAIITDVNTTGAHLEHAIWIDSQLCGPDSLGECHVASGSP